MARGSWLVLAAYYKIQTVMRPRDFDRVTSAPCDLLIVGGTYQGLAIAREAAARGLRATLIEPADFGADVSSHHAPIVPGGLHLLRHGHLTRARRAVRARRRLARIAPWLIRPLPFLEATRRRIPGNRIAWRAIFKIDDWIGRHRNDGVEPELHLPPARLVSQAATLRLFPGVQREGLTGAIQWYDYQILDGSRFSVALAADAEAAGAELLNRVDLIDVLRDEDRTVGVKVRDTVTGAQAGVRSDLLIHAGSDDSLSLLGLPQAPAKARYVSLSTSKSASDIALTAALPNGERLTLVPWQGRAIVGLRLPLTPPAGATPDLSRLVAYVNHAFPALGLTEGDISSVHATIETASLDGQATEISDRAGPIVVRSTNAAAALDAAARVVRLAARKIGKQLRPVRVEKPLPGGGIADHEALLIETARSVGIEVPQPVMRHLISRYAEQSAAIVRLMAAETQLTQPLSARTPHVAAEIVHAIRQEKAVHLSDIVTRRLGLGASTPIDEDALSGVAAFAARELEWDSARVNAELEGLRSSNP